MIQGQPHAMHMSGLANEYTCSVVSISLWGPALSCRRWQNSFYPLPPFLSWRL